MINECKLTLIDSDLYRRAHIGRVLMEHHLHVEPLENVAEIKKVWPKEGVIIAEDVNGQVQNLVQLMAERSNWLPIIAFSEKPTTHCVVDAILNGAIDYINWPESIENVLEAIDKAEEKSKRISGLKLREARARVRVQRLTQREQQVLSWVAKGLSNQLISEKLSISPRTVEIHRANMLSKLGANHTSQAIRIAIESALVP